MKKNIIVVIAASCLIFTACKSTPKKSAAKKTEAAAPETEAETTEEKPAAESGNNIGWIKSRGKDIAENFGIMQLKLKAKFGSYTINLINNQGKKVPVLASTNEFTTNAFYLKTSQKTYCLTSDTSIKSSLQKKADGVAVLYSVPNVADVTVEFKTMSTEKKASENMVKVVITVANNGKRNDEFHIKAILDTILGESDSYHFYTWEGIPIKNEVLYRTLQNQKWFNSKNLSAAMQMFFSGADCTTPSVVALGNYSTFEKNTWEPDMNSFRAFDTVLSYNNSAVCAIWNPLKLSVGESGKVVFYLAFGVDGIKPEGEKVIYAEENNPKPAVQAVEAVKNPRLDSSYGLVKEIPDSPENAQVETVKENENPAVPDVDFYIQNLTPDHLTNEYIQSLLDRIASLEENSSTLNRQEIMELNAELDAILTYLGQ